MKKIVSLIILLFLCGCDTRSTKNKGMDYIGVDRIACWSWYNEALNSEQINDLMERGCKED